MLKSFFSDKYFDMVKGRTTSVVLFSYLKQEQEVKTNAKYIQEGHADFLDGMYLLNTGKVFLYLEGQEHEKRADCYKW